MWDAVAPELLPRIAYWFVWRPDEPMEPFGIDRHLADGDTLPVTGGLKVIGTPGHCADWPRSWRGDRLLIAGDVGMNIIGLGNPVGFENEAEGRRSQRGIAGLRFDSATFGHGSAIRSGASERVRKAWGGR